MSIKPFRVKSCEILATATSHVAYTLREFQEQLTVVSEESIYYHFWSPLLRPQVNKPPYCNSFAMWADQGLGDSILAEQLAVVEPALYGDARAVRQTLVHIIEDRLRGADGVAHLAAKPPFHFIYPQYFVFDTPYQIESPELILEVLPRLSRSSIFYHFVYMRRRAEVGGEDDLRLWLQASGLACVEQLLRHLNSVSPTLLHCDELRDRLMAVFTRHLEGQRE